MKSWSQQRCQLFCRFKASLCLMPWLRSLFSQSVWVGLVVLSSPQSACLSRLCCGVGMPCTWRGAETGSNRRMVQHEAACPPPAPADTLSRADTNVCVLASLSLCVCEREREKEGWGGRRKQHRENHTRMLCLQNRGQNVFAVNTNSSDLVIVFSHLERGSSLLPAVSQLSAKTLSRPRRHAGADRVQRAHRVPVHLIPQYKHLILFGTCFQQKLRSFKDFHNPAILWWKYYYYLLLYNIADVWQQEKSFHSYTVLNDELLRSDVKLITMLPCITTSSLLNPPLIIASKLTSSVCCVFVVAPPGRGCHLFRLSVCFKGGSALWMTA